MKKVRVQHALLTPILTFPIMIKFTLCSIATGLFLLKY